MPETYEAIPQVIQGPKGWNGWSPIFAAIPDGERSVLQLIDWTGGEGTKPEIGGYLATSGLVEDLALALDIRGAAGKPNEPFKIEIAALVAEMTASISEAKTYKVAAESANLQAQNAKDGTLALLRQATAAAATANAAQQGVALSAQAAERAKTTAETVKDSVFTARSDAQQARTEAQAAQAGAEAAQTGAETAQAAAETAQAGAEAAKVATHTAQNVATNARDLANDAKAAAQGFAQNAAGSAVAAATTVSQVTTIKQEAIDQIAVIKQQTEGVRDEALQAKTTALSARTQAQTARTGAETAQTGAETAKAAAETALAGANAAKGTAEATLAGSEAAKVAAQTARTGAETARTGAETAKTGAETAKTGAETARTGAQTAQTGAETARTGAEKALADTMAYQGQFQSLTAFDFIENLYLNSQAGVTTKANDTTIISNAATAPDGGQAFKMVEGTANAEKIIYFNLNRPATSQEITFSVFLKPAGRKIVGFWVMGSVYTATRRLRIDLETLTITQLSASGELPVVTKTSIIPVVDGWLRFSVTYQSTADSLIMGRLDLINSNVTNYVGDGVSGILFYGPQYSYTNRAIPYVETSGQAIPKTPFKVLNDSTLGGATPSAQLPASQQSLKTYAAPISKPVSVSSTNLTLAVGDASKILPVDSPTTTVVTIPLHATAAIPVGSEIVLFQRGTGAISVFAVRGVTLRSRGGRMRTRSQNDTLMLRKVAENEWVLSGEMAFPLDQQNAHSAWSLRRLVATYSGAVLRVRRSSDNAETDVFFDTTDQVSSFSLTSSGQRLSDWAAGNLFVKTLFNQVGPLHFTNATAAEQPQLMLTGNLRDGGAFLKFSQGVTRMNAGVATDWTYLHDGTGMTLLMTYSNMPLGNNGGVWFTFLNSISADSGALGAGLRLRNVSTNTRQVVLKASSADQVFAQNWQANMSSTALETFILRHASSQTNQVQWFLNNPAGLMVNLNYLMAAGTTPGNTPLTLGGTSFDQSISAQMDFLELVLYKGLVSDNDLYLIR